MANQESPNRWLPILRPILAGLGEIPGMGVIAQPVLTLCQQDVEALTAKQLKAIEKGLTQLGRELSQVSDQQLREAQVTREEIVSWRQQLREIAAEAAARLEAVIREEAAQTRGLVREEHVRTREDIATGQAELVQRFDRLETAMERLQYRDGVAQRPNELQAPAPDESAALTPEVRKYLGKTREVLKDTSLQIQAGKLDKVEARVSELAAAIEQWHNQLLGSGEYTPDVMTATSRSVGELLTAAALQRGTVFFERHEYTEAAQWYGTALGYARGVGHREQIAMALYLTGVACAFGGEVAQAEGWFRQVVVIQPNNADAHNNLGTALDRQRNLKEAICEYRKALRCGPNDAAVHYNLGNALYKQCNLDEAIQEYREAIRADSNYADAYSNLGVALDDQGKADEAIHQWRKAIRANPNYAEAHSNLGVALYRQGKLEEALREYREAIRCDPNLAAAHSNLGNALARQEKLDEAIREFREAIRCDPNDATAHHNLAIALLRAGDYAGAWREVHATQKLGATFPEERLAELRKEMPEPPDEDNQGDENSPPVSLIDEDEDE